MQFKLISRTELADVSKRQLQFVEMPVPENFTQSVQLSGYFDAAFAATLTVGSTYELTLTEVV